ncbi:MAG: hypothetical protein ACE5OP_09090 [Candidatus Glassbacteria bacterium]
MAKEYSTHVIRELEKGFQAASLERPMRVDRYEADTELVYDVTGVAKGDKGRIRLIVEKFVGGGFAGQVYRVKLTDIESDPVEGLEVGKVYAMKILVPQKAFSRLFRNFLYWIGFQGPFQLQTNPAAARAGALWQKFIRRGAKIRLGSENAVVDIYATFVDTVLGSYGELSEWVDGRTWRLEVDDRMDLLRSWVRGSEVDAEGLGSPEYRAKRLFMHEFVGLLHDMGAHEFARQYEWSTCKSQPNCLRRNNESDSPSEGLVAVDFRAGLALLPFLPMSPGDFKLIAQGIKRGSLVQFDRGDLGKLEDFVESHSEEFGDMHRMLEELKSAESVYRDSVPDITHNHHRLLTDRRLWRSILDSAVTGWRVRNLIDDRCQEKLGKNRAFAILFYMLGMMPLAGTFIMRILGRPDWRKHYKRLSTSMSYLRRAVYGNLTEKAIGWHRAGRIDGMRALEIAKHPWRILYHLPLSVLPAGLHRFLTDWQYAKGRLAYLFVRPIRLYFNAKVREEWLIEMVKEGKDKQLLLEEDAEVILSQINEPFIQKYLKALAVHVCTLPVTQIVSVTVALIYSAMHPEMPRAEAWAIGLGIIALFQVIPVSPGSLVRGFYVLYLVIRERNFKDYNIAAFLSFFKYIGYLAFPIQMGYRYPALARFMATHWATEAVHHVPVFGERGALLEHGVFALFYNWPLTLRRRMRKRSQVRASIKPRYWHIALCTLAGLGMFWLVDFLYLQNSGRLPGLNQIWWLAVLVPLLCGAAVTLGAGGASLPMRIVGAAVCGIAVAILYTVISAVYIHGGSIGLGSILAGSAWRVFIFTLSSTFGVILTELKLPEPSEQESGH